MPGQWLAQQAAHQPNQLLRCCSSHIKDVLAGSAWHRCGCTKEASVAGARHQCGEEAWRVVGWLLHIDLVFLPTARCVGVVVASGDLAAWPL